jgi:hypothetical protein
MGDIVFGYVIPSAESFIAADACDSLAVNLGLDELCAGFSAGSHAQTAPAGPLQRDRVIAETAAVFGETVKEGVAAGI